MNWSLVWLLPKGHGRPRLIDLPDVKSKFLKGCEVFQGLAALILLEMRIEYTEAGAVVETVIQFGDDLVLAICETEDSVANKGLSKNKCLTPEGIDNILSLFGAVDVVELYNRSGIRQNHPAPLFLVFDERGALDIVGFRQPLD